MHVLLLETPRTEEKEERPVHPAACAPRLFVYNTRTRQGAAHMMEKMNQLAHDVYVHALLEPSANMALNKMKYRMYTVLNAKTRDYSFVKVK